MKPLKIAVIAAAAGAILTAALWPKTIEFARHPEISATSTVADADPGGHLALDAARAARLNAYFKARGMPLEGQGELLAVVARENGLDWRLLPAIAIRESTGGKQACGYNPFGWNSCRGEAGQFDSWEDAIRTVGKALGSGRYYAGKTVTQKLQTYNPPSIVPDYAMEVIRIMEDIWE